MAGSSAMGRASQGPSRHTRRGCPLLRLFDLAGRAATIQVLVVAVVAAFARVVLHDAVAAARAQHAALGAAAVGAGKLAVVAVFLSLHDAVAAVRPRLAA